jgi:sarcosine oxidase
MTGIIVIGAGLAGSAAAWRLAQAGHEVTVLERSTPANEHGSSHGSARIFRYAYRESFYTSLVLDASRGWDELASVSGQQLITPSGALDFGSTREPELLAKILEEVGVEHELLSRQAAESRWDLAFDTSVLWHPGAGVIDAENSVHAMLTQAAAHGARVLHNWSVDRVERVGSGYRAVRADGAGVEAEQIVVAAGGWLPDLLDKLALPDAFLAGFPALEVRQEQAYHFPYRDEQAAAAARVVGEAAWPTFIYKSPDIQTYGLPGGRDAAWRGQKVAEYNGGKRLPSAAAHDDVLDDANRRRVVSYVERFLPGLVPEPYAETTCLFTNAPNEDFVIDRIDGITVMSPCSGHGAKFAPLIGEYALALVDGMSSVPHAFRPSLAVTR